jgi:predicted RNA methylase
MSHDLVTIRPHQHALPLAGVNRPTATPAQRPPSGFRPIHISDFDRRGRDFYATPNWVTEALLQHIRFRGPIWEPCCGAGAMSTVLAGHGYEVVSTDIADCGFGTPGVDFLASRTVRDGYRSIITNPPYGEAAIHEGQARSPKAMLEFLRHALALTATVQGQLALLVRLQWIAGKRVAEVMTAAPFAAVLVLTRRIRWFDMGEHTNNGQHNHAWVVFDHAHPPGCPPVLLYS